MLVPITNMLISMTEEHIDKVRLLESSVPQKLQIDIPVEHFLHGGNYVRTVNIPSGVMITGALIKLATTIVVNGHAKIYTGDDWIECEGYNIIPAPAYRKQIFVAISDINLTMFFPTDAKTVKDAEEQFTDEFNLLQNRARECQELQLL